MLGLISELNEWYFASVLLIAIYILFCICGKKEYPFLISLIILALILWGTPNIVEQNPRVWDSWKVGFLTESVIKSNGVDFSKVGEYEYEYLQFPGSFILFAFLMLITNLKILIFMKIYPLIFSIPLTFFLIYSFFRSYFSNIKLARISTIILLLVNMYFHFHLSPESLGMILLLSFLILLNKKALVSVNLLFCLIIFAAVIIHPTTSFILVLILLSYIILLSIFSKTINVAYIKLWFVSLVAFSSWFIYVSFIQFKQIFIKLVAQNPFSLDASSTTHQIIFLTQYVRTAIFVLGMIISIIYILHLYYSGAKPILLTSFYAVSVVFYFIGSGIGLSERSFQIGFMVICPIFAYLIHKYLLLRNSSLRFLLLFFLCTTATIYMYEYRDIQPENLIHGYNFILDNKSNGSYMILQDYYQSQVFLLLNRSNYDKLVSMDYGNLEILSDIKNKNKIAIPSIISFSEGGKQEAIMLGFNNEYNILQDNIENNLKYNKIYETTTMASYVK